MQAQVFLHALHLMAALQDYKHLCSRSDGKGPPPHTRSVHARTLLLLRLVRCTVWVNRIQHHATVSVDKGQLVPSGALPYKELFRDCLRIR